MLMKPDLIPPNSSSPALRATTVCGNCGAEERRLLHHVRHRGIFRRLCTTCVLRLHPQSFCPTCFQVYPPPPSNDAVLTCFKCYSSSHSHCVEAAGPASPPSPYVCPLCLHPNKPVFQLKSAKDVEIGEGKNEGFRVMDRDAARKLLAAAKIASASMNKAAVAAKAEAERRAKEAAFTRKRAKESLEHVARLVMRKKADALGAAGNMTGPGLGGNVGYPIGGVVKMERENNASAYVNVISSSNRNGNGNGSVAAALGPSMVVEEKTNTAANVNRVDNSNPVLPKLDAVGLRENEKIGGGVTAQSVALIDNHLMDADEMGSMIGENVGERSNDSGGGGGGGGHVNLADMESVAENMNTQEDDLDDVNGDVVLVEPPAVDEMQYENSNGVKQSANGS